MNEREINAVILAGGEASRMRGVDKPFAPLNGRPLIEHVLARLQGKVGQIVVSANKNLERFASYGLACVSDEEFPQQTPLLGIHSALQYFTNARGKDQGAESCLFCIPVDVPVFPASLIAELRDEAEQSENGVAYLQTRDQPQPLIAVWSLRSLPLLEKALQAGAWGALATLKALRARVLQYSPVNGIDFANINSPEDLQNLQDQLRRDGIEL